MNDEELDITELENVVASLNEDTVSVTCSIGNTITSWEKPLCEFDFNSLYDTHIRVKKINRYKIFLWTHVEDNILLIYSKGSTIRCILTSENNAYLRLIDRANRVLSATLDKKHLRIVWFGGIRNTYNATISDCKLIIDDQTSQEFDMPVSDRLIHSSDRIHRKFIKTFTFKTSELAKDNTPINCSIKIQITINGFVATFPLSMKKSKIRNKREYYIPTHSIYYRGFVMHLRRSLNGNLVFVRRTMESVEHTAKFRFFENSFVSCMLYFAGKTYTKLARQQKCLFYEKFSEKAEEGVFDLFFAISQNKRNKSYFIIDKTSEDYNKVREVKNVVVKYTFKYYWLLFTSTYCISTDSPTHLNILRSNNHFLRKNLICDKKFIFLQHGITYLKFHGKNSPYCLGKEAEPTYMVVDSEKELDICSQMLGLEHSRFLKTGIPIFSQIDYKHINQDSPDVVMIMLTWKPYEEYLTDFEQSNYYQNTVALYNLLTQYLPSENIIISCHPKVESLMQGTHMASRIWHEPISEALKQAKLLITDYSSVCYNSFYQGGAVIFFQEDLAYYEQENGPLIPQNDEYIGERVFSISQLDTLLKEGICDGQIMLDRLHTTEHEQRYQTINEFHDGKNIQRICEALKDKGIIR